MEARSVERGYFFYAKDSGFGRVATLAFSRADGNVQRSVAERYFFLDEKHVGESPASIPLCDFSRRVNVVRGIVEDGYFSHLERPSSNAYPRDA